MKRTTTLFILAALMIACSGAKKQASSSNQKDSATEKCFFLEGLKYNNTIRMTIDPDGTVNGTMQSNENASGKTYAATFSGTKTGDKLKITFHTEAPTVGVKSEWTDNDWRLGKKDRKETLFITFNAQNYETMQWEETEYEFSACSSNALPNTQVATEGDVTYPVLTHKASMGSDLKNMSGNENVFLLVKNSREAMCNSVII